MTSPRVSQSRGIMCRISTRHKRSRTETHLRMSSNEGASLLRLSKSRLATHVILVSANAHKKPSVRNQEHARYIWRKLK